MASNASLQNFSGMNKDSFPSDWFAGFDEVRILNHGITSECL